MKLHRLALAALMVSLGIGSQANAGQYAATELGESLPMWMETLASINDHGDVAWTAFDNNSSEARFYTDNADTALFASKAHSWAVSITDERFSDGVNHVIGIAGSHASHQNLTDRSALYWNVFWLDNNSPPTTQGLDLGAVTEPLDPDSRGPDPSDPEKVKTVQQSAAYAIYAKDLNDYYVGGFARDKVNKTTFPQPVIWHVSNPVNNPDVSVHALPPIKPDADNASGYVASIAHNDENNKTWACGNSTGEGSYNQATCWDITNGAENATTHPNLLSALASAEGLGANVTIASSMVHRVRVVPAGPNGELQTIAVGAALIGTNSARAWKGWTYNLDTGVIHKDLGLTGDTNDHETFAYDVAALQYENGTNTPSRGMIVAGISSSTPTSTIGGLPGQGDINTAPTTMRGVDRRIMLSGIADNGQVCAIKDDSQNLNNNYQQLLALSSDGAYRLAMNQQQLVRLSNSPDEATLEIRNRDATVRPNHFTSREPKLYYQAQLDSGNTAAAAQVRFAKALACAPVAEIGGSDACHNDHPASYDIADELVLDLNRSNPEQALRSAKQEQKLFDASDYNYAQIALRGDDGCSLTPVFAINEITVEESSSHDFDGKQWLQCDNDKFVDPMTDYEHCDGCNQLAELTGTGVSNQRPLSQCLYGQCVGGNVVIETNEPQRYKADHCYIEGNCWNANEANPIDAQAETAANLCQECKPNKSQSEWSNPGVTPCCDGSFNPTITGWHEGYRPEGDNIEYNGSTLTSTWIRRIPDITDRGLWGEWTGLSDNTYRCTQLGNGTDIRRVKKLTSHISEADQEDWFVFRQQENKGQNNYPRVRAVPSTQKKVELCVYPRCIDTNFSQNERTAWATELVTSITGTQHGRIRALVGPTPPVPVLAGDSPLQENGLGLPGACTSSYANGEAADLFLVVEDYNEKDRIEQQNLKACWNVDYFVQVQSDNATNDMTCEDPYNLFWGNWQTRWGSTWYSPDYMRNNYGHHKSECDNSGSTVFHTP